MLCLDRVTDPSWLVASTGKCGFLREGQNQHAAKLSISNSDKVDFPQHEIGKFTIIRSIQKACPCEILCPSLQSQRLWLHTPPPGSLAGSWTCLGMPLHLHTCWSCIRVQQKLGVAHALGFLESHSCASPCAWSCTWAAFSGPRARKPSSDTATRPLS